VAHRVRRGRLVDPGIANRLPHRALECLVAQMVPPDDPAARVH
jgi:predicted hotdog family 3-hydroxylacyl-ACP dehydratase